LSRAYRSYVDLLAHLHTTKRAQHSKATSDDTTHASSKLLLYPKPPKVGHPGAIQRPERGPSTASQAYNAGNERHSYHADEPEPGNAREEERAYQDHASAPSLQAPQFPYTVPYGGALRPAIEIHHPADVARDSLEILNSLCEQSGWKWIDGMLLGGCLHFGLDHYDDALNWFSRITALDSR
jgi:hypothetical protein